MTHPMKKAGYSQGIYSQKATCRKEMLGEYRLLRDGRGFRFGYASETIGIGKMTHATRLDTEHLNEAILVAVPKGEYTLDLTVTTGVAIAEDELRGGYFEVQDGSGEGQNLLIAGNSALGSGGVKIQILLDDPIQIALDTDSEFSLTRSEWYETALSTVEQNFATGVPPISLTALFYAWFQTHGQCNVLINGTPAVGSELILSGTEGAVDVVNTTKVVEVPTIGYKTHAAGVDGEYCPVFLTID